MTNECPKCQTGNPDNSKFCKECATPLPGIQDAIHTTTLETLTEELKRGSVFAGRYEIIEELGKGGMGRVYRVEDKKIKKEIALKLIKPEIASDKKTIERFKNELTIAREIRHKNVCGMFDLGEEKGQHFITMEYVHGGDLKRFIRRSEQLSVGKAITIAKQICEGLTEAHNLGIVHRDLKPNNIMIDDNGNARIMDFGIARSIKGKGITGSGIMIGTPEYMSPEQVEAKDIDQRSDIYSLGIIMYEMLTGRRPFEADTPFAIGVKHKSEIPTNPKEFNSQIPDDLSGVILKCLEKEKESRYKSAGELLSEIEKIEQGLPTASRQISTSRSTTPKQITVSFTPKKFLIPTVVLVALILAVVLIWKPWKGSSFIQPTESGLPSIAVLYFRNGTGDISLDHWREDLCDSLITDLSQSKYIRTISYEQIYSIFKKLSLLDVKNYGSEDLIEISNTCGADFVLIGSLSKAGELFEIKYTLQDMNNGINIGAGSFEGSGVESIFPLVDQLTVKIKEDLNLTEIQLSSDQDMELGVITTPFSEAYRLYREGRALYFKLDFQASITFMKRAIEIDPDFAMAYRSIASAYSNIGGNLDKIKEYLTKAKEKSDRLSYLEKKIIEAQYSERVERDSYKALTIWEELLKDYPESNFINFSLGAYYSSRMDMDKAISYLEICHENRYEFTAVLLGMLYMSKGEYEKARKIYRDNIDYFGDTALMRANIADSYIFEGQLDKAIPEAKKAIEMNPRAFRMGIFDHLRGNFDVAENDYEQWINDSSADMRMNVYQWLAILNMTQGKYEKAMSFIEEGLALAKKEEHQIYELEFLKLKSWRYFALRNYVDALVEAQTMLIRASQFEIPISQIISLLLQSWIYNKTDQSEKVREIAYLVEKQLETFGTTNRMITFIDLSFKGMVDLADKNYKSAVKKSNEALPMRFRQWSWTDDHIIGLFLMGETNLLAEDLESARKAYELGLNLTSGKIYFGDLWAKSHLRLGEVYEKLGNRDKAIEHTEKFLEMWKDADPGLPEVDDAKKRLAGLK